MLAVNRHRYEVTLARQAGALHLHEWADMVGWSNQGLNLAKGCWTDGAHNLEVSGVKGRAKHGGRCCVLQGFDDLIEY